MASAPKTPPTPKAARAAWGTINRQQIVDAATRAVRSGGGYQQMTIRSLAADMGVSPMSLYHHVRDKDDLLDEVVDRLLVRTWRPRAHSQDWRTWVVEVSDKLRHFLVSQPAALHVYLRHPVVSPAAIARMEAVMAVLRDALGNEDSARRAYAAIHTYTVGFAALEASRAAWDSEPDDLPPATHRDASDSGARRDRTDAEPGRLAVQLAAYTTTRQFSEGLHYLLDGIVTAGKDLTTPPPASQADND